MEVIIYNVLPLYIQPSPVSAETVTFPMTVDVYYMAEGVYVGMLEYTPNQKRQGK